MIKPTPQSADDAIDQALASLRTAEAPAGLEARVVASLQCRESLASTPVRSLNRRWFPAALSLGSAFALLIVLLLLRSPRTASTRAPTHHPPSTVSAGIGPEPLVRKHVSLQRTFARGPRVLLSSGPASLSSFPAPPAPLTTQEKLLLQVAHHADQEDFDLLNPESAARELAHTMADFDRFFPPPSPLPNPGQPSTPQDSTATPTSAPETPDDVHPAVR